MSRQFLSGIWPHQQILVKRFFLITGLLNARKIVPFLDLCPIATFCFSTTYTPSFSDQSMKAGNARLSWKKDLILDIFEEDWECIHTSIHQGSVNMTVQENGCKIQLHW